MSGTVSKIDGKDVEIRVAEGDGKKIRKGQKVRLFYVTSAGKDLPVGTWEVAEVNGDTAKAAPADVVGDPRVGLKAVFEFNEDGRPDKPEKEGKTSTVVIHDPKSFTIENKGLFSSDYNSRTINSSSENMTKTEFQKGRELYYGLNNVPLDYVQAEQHLRKAAEKGHAEAQNILGVIYGMGQGVAPNYDEAVKWYRKSAEQGFPKGQYNLGVMYAKGKGVLKDYAEAFKWFDLAAKQGDREAQHNLGTLYLHGLGTPKDYNSARYWFQRACAQDLAPSFYALGEMYEKGLGVAADEATAVSFYQKAAALNYPAAQNALKKRGLGW